MPSLPASNAPGRPARTQKPWDGWRLPTPHVKDGALPAEYAPGDVIAGKYRLESVLGEGGMGAVWLARNLTLDVDVAIKLIRRDVVSPETSQRLLQEARAAARLGHPSIVRVFDFGVSEHHDPFMVMEVLHGELLSEVLERKVRLAATNAVSTLLPVISALDAAHGKGIVHRDLKPDNILLVSDATGSATPKVLDFGVAKLRREDGIERRLTQGRTVMGTPDYMSPEQACGENSVDGRADIWALCVILYEAITGRRPFEGDDVRSLFTAIVSSHPTPITELGGGDRALWAILARGLTKAPAQRWLTMRAFGHALAQWAVDRGVENDVAGTSIAAHWLQERRPLSDQPPRASLPSASGVEPPRSLGAPPVSASRPTLEPPLAEPRSAAPLRSTPELSAPPRVIAQPAPVVRIEIASDPTDAPHTIDPRRARGSTSRPERRTHYRWFAAVAVVGLVVAYGDRESLSNAFTSVAPAQPAPVAWTQEAAPPSASGPSEIASADVVLVAVPAERPPLQPAAPATSSSGDPPPKRDASPPAPQPLRPISAAPSTTSAIARAPSPSSTSSAAPVPSVTSAALAGADKPAKPRPASSFPVPAKPNF